jgi:hypothetical protein
VASGSACSAPSATAPCCSAIAAAAKNAVASLDDGYGVVVTANSDNGFRIFDEITRAVFVEYGWPGADPVVVRTALEPAQRARFVGQFLDWAAPVAIAEQADRLVLPTPFEPPVERVPIAPDSVEQRDSDRRCTSTTPARSKPCADGRTRS